MNDFFSVSIVTVLNLSVKGSWLDLGEFSRNHPIGRSPTPMTPPDSGALVIRFAQRNQ
jgi:hypothetical protein